MSQVASTASVYPIGTSSDSQKLLLRGLKFCVGQDPRFMQLPKVL